MYTIYPVWNMSYANIYPWRKGVFSWRQLCWCGVQFRLSRPRPWPCWNPSSLQINRGTAFHSKCDTGSGKWQHSGLDITLQGLVGFPLTYASYVSLTHNEQAYIYIYIFPRLVWLYLRQALQYTANSVNVQTASCFTCTGIYTGLPRPGPTNESFVFVH